MPKCQEYCKGNRAEFYCRECAAMFCKDCYDREHSCGSARKAQHEKMNELRPVCLQHKHTLDFFNLTLLQPMCLICKKDNLLTVENSQHVVDSIEGALPKLKVLLKEKLDMARTLLSSMRSELETVEKTAEKTADYALKHLRVCFSKVREILDARELELEKVVRRRCRQFLAGDGQGNEISDNLMVLEKATAAGNKVVLPNSIKFVVISISVCVCGWVQWVLFEGGYPSKY